MVKDVGRGTMHLPREIIRPFSAEHSHFGNGRNYDRPIPAQTLFY